MEPIRPMPPSIQSPIIPSHALLEASVNRIAQDAGIVSGNKIGKASQGTADRNHFNRAEALNRLPSETFFSFIVRFIKQLFVTKIAKKLAPESTPEQKLKNLKKSLSELEKEKEKAIEEKELIDAIKLPDGFTYSHPHQEVLDNARDRVEELYKLLKQTRTSIKELEQVIQSQQ